MRRAWFRVGFEDAASGDGLPSSDCPCCGRQMPFGRARSGIVLSAEEAAFLLGVSRPTVVRLVQTGWLNGAKRGRNWRVNLDEVVRVLALEATRRSQALDEVVRSRRNHDPSSSESQATEHRIPWITGPSSRSAH